MITASSISAQPERWQQELARAITDPGKLIEALNLPFSLLGPAIHASELFPLRVTRHYLGLMRQGDENDPLLRQVLPLEAEQQQVAGFTPDPVGDHAASLGAGLLHKYQGRALLITTGACAIHCRYCFRRHYPYAKDNAIRHWEEMLQGLRDRPDINEVILSGGDPLSLSDTRLQQLLAELENIGHLRRLRIHTRLPIVLPERITPSLLEALGTNRLNASVVLHCNHPNELAEALRMPLSQLRGSGVTLLNQAVLLAGVNDQLETQVALSERLFEFGVLPYYLHLLDAVEGAAHFSVPAHRQGQIEAGLEAQLPGYLVPKLVREVAGATSKTPRHRLSNK